ncbi:MAG: hypothetical protein AAGB12_15400 [Pseudomonadota bacterium]
MGQNERKAYLEAIRERYKKASKSEKSAILDEFCAVCGYHRKYAIRVLSTRPKPPPRKPGRKPRYDHQKLLPVLKLDFG